MLLTSKKQQKTEVHIRPIPELYPSVQALIGIAREKGEPEIKDINGGEIELGHLIRARKD